MNESLFFALLNSKRDTDTCECARTLRNTFWLRTRVFRGFLLTLDFLLSLREEVDGSPFWFHRERHGLLAILEPHTHLFPSKTICTTLDNTLRIAIAQHGEEIITRDFALVLLLVRVVNVRECLRTNL